jgi:hypothetical protein
MSDSRPLGRFMSPACVFPAVRQHPSAALLSADAEVATTSSRNYERIGTSTLRHETNGAGCCGLR